MTMIATFGAGGAASAPRTPASTSLWKKYLSRFVQPKGIRPGGLAGMKVERVLLVQLDARVESLLLLTPLLAELESNFPGVVVDLITGSDDAREVFQEFPSVRNVFLVPPTRTRKVLGAAAFARFCNSRYDLAIDFGTETQLGCLAAALVGARMNLIMPDADNAAWSRAMFSAPSDPARLPVYLLRRALVCEEQRDETLYASISLRLGSNELASAHQVATALELAGYDPDAFVVGVISSGETSVRPSAALWLPLIEDLQRSHPSVVVLEVLVDREERRIDGIPACKAPVGLRALAALIATLHGAIVTDERLLAVVSASGTPLVFLHDLPVSGAGMPGSAVSIRIGGRSPRQIASTMLRVFGARVATKSSGERPENPHFRIAARIAHDPCRLLRDRAIARQVRPRDANPLRRARSSSAILALMLAFRTGAAVAGGPFGIDHLVAYDNSGIWKRNYQTTLAFGTVAVVAGGALWLGDDDALGDTLWRSVDAMAFTAVSTEAMKFTFSRERPSQTTNPNRFFTGHGNASFPSGEVAEISAAVTPLMIRYGADHPAVYALALLPLYDAVARVKVRGHWQSDVLVGAAVGAGIGYYATGREHPFVLGLLPGGLQVGFSHSFR